MIVLKLEAGSGCVCVNRGDTKAQSGAKLLVFSFVDLSVLASQPTAEFLVLSFADLSVFAPLRLMHSFFCEYGYISQYR